MELDPKQRQPFAELPAIPLPRTYRLALLGKPERCLLMPKPEHLALMPKPETA